MYQTMKPDRIILYLGTDVKDCPIKQENELIQAGLTIKRNVEDLKPHKKYFYAMQEFKDSIVITIDDDIIYDDALIEELYQKHLEYQDVVICRRGHRMKRKENQLDSYSNWEFCVASVQPSNDICPTGVGGVLYPCGSYRDSLLNREAIIKNALNADDLWLKTVELINGIKAYAIKDIPLRYIHDTQEESLQALNLEQGENDIALKQIQNYFSINIASMIGL